jgi:hypothetical protein
MKTAPAPQSPPLADATKPDDARRRIDCYASGNLIVWTYYHNDRHLWFFEHWEDGRMIVRLSSQDIDSLTARFIRVVCDATTRRRIVKAPYVSKDHLPKGRPLKGVRVFDPALRPTGRSILPIDR